MRGVTSDEFILVVERLHKNRDCVFGFRAYLRYGTECESTNKRLFVFHCLQQSRKNYDGIRTDITTKDLAGGVTNCDVLISQAFAECFNKVASILFWPILRQLDGSYCIQSRCPLGRLHLLQ